MWTGLYIIFLPSNSDKLIYLFIFADTIKLLQIIRWSTCPYVPQNKQSDGYQFIKQLRSEFVLL